MFTSGKSLGFPRNYSLVKINKMISDALTSASFSGFKIGDVIGGKYKIIKEIGRGGSSVVYLARDIRLGKLWAVKAVKELESLAEAELMKDLDYPAFPRIVDILKPDGIFCIIMDFIEGKTLSQIVREQGPVPEDLALEWGKRLCESLNYLHTRTPPILYLDLKPSNVIISSEGNIKIIDFGASRRRGDDVPVYGTRGYSPREQYRGNADERSDIYSFGMTLYFALTGKDAGKIRKKSFRRANSGLSEGIRGIVNKCIRPDPEERYQSCRELLRALDSFGRKKEKIIKSRKIIISAAVIIAVCICIGNLAFAASLKQKIAGYEALLTENNPNSYYTAISTFPEKIDAYLSLVRYYESYDVSNDEIVRVGNIVQNNSDLFAPEESDTGRLYYETGKLFFSAYDGTQRDRALNAVEFFRMAVSSEYNFEGKEIAACYLSICSLLVGTSKISEASYSDYDELFYEIKETLELLDEAEGSEVNYDRISFYYAVLVFINSQSFELSRSGFPEASVLKMIDLLYVKAKAVTSSLIYVQNLQEKISSDYFTYVTNIVAMYNETEKEL